MRTLYLLSVYLHILMAILWLGSMLFLGIGIVPLLRRPEYRTLAPELLGAIGMRLRYLGWLAVSLLFLTGLFNLSYRLGGLKELLTSSFWSSPYGSLLAQKLLFVFLVMLLTAYHDFSLGPRTLERLQRDPEDPVGLRLRRQASWLGRLTVLFSLVILYFAIRLVRG